MKKSFLTILLLFCAVSCKHKSVVYEECDPYQIAETRYDSLDWWNTFDDTLLSDLVEDSMCYNHNIKAARLRIAEARSLKKAACGALLPDIQVSGTYQRFRFSENGIIPIPTLAKEGLIKEKQDLFDIGFDACWEVDLFGGKRAKLRSAKEQVCQIIEERRNLMISIAAEVAETYLALRGDQQLLANAEKRVALQKAIVETLSYKEGAGLGSELQISMATTQLNEMKSELSLLTTDLLIKAHRLSVLTGRPPEYLVKRLEQNPTNPIAPDFDPSYISAEVLTQRPDVRAVEHALQAQAAEVDAAKAALFPSLWLFALYRLQSMKLSDLFTPGSQWWFFGPLVNWKLFERFQLEANWEAEKARYKRLFEELDQQVLLALEDTANAYQGYKGTKESYRLQQKAQHASEKSLHFTTQLEKSGLKGYLDLLEAERNTTVTKERLIRLTVDYNRQTVRLYKALGGGWRQLDSKIP